MARREAPKKPEIKTLEQGDIYFFYRPRVQEEQPEGLSDVQRFYVVLSSDGFYRLLVVGHKKMPDPEQRGHRKYWGFVEMVADNADTIRDELGGTEYGTKTQGERFQPGARPAGEGIYRILRHGDHTHLVYSLELPHEPGQVQEDLQIEEEASYIISVKNPEQGGPQGPGLSKDREVDYPQDLIDVFDGRRFANVDPPDLLNYEAAEFILIPASGDIEQELGIKLDVNRESLDSADLFKDLRMDKKNKPTEPLTKGEWK
jgi:hypothetical protein